VSFGRQPASKQTDKQKHRKGSTAVISLKQLLAAITRTKWVWIGLAAVLALRFYYVREMIAALMIFSVLFAAGAIVALVVFLVDRASRQIVIWAEAGLGAVVHWVTDAAEAIFAKPVWAQAVSHRFRKELKQNGKI
jgi:hypothetical protein